MLKKEELAWAKEYFNVANYISASSIYLKSNFLIEKSLKSDDIKPSLLGHWGTCPGINFIYTHLNLLASEKNQQIMLVTGPGHGAAAILANLFLEGTLEKYYPELKRDKNGLGKLIKSFCWPGGFPSHVNPGVPGSIHEGGELGYALATAFGASFDNSDLIVVAIIGDGEAETGPTATAWHSSKFLNPEKDGAVLPILHLNEYKISSPSIYGTMTDSELKSLFTGYGYEPIFVSGNHQEMHNAILKAYDKIKSIQQSARKGKPIERPAWPVIILKTKKGWTAPKKFGKETIEGSYRSHQVPLKDAKTNPKALKALKKWLESYKPNRFIENDKIRESILRFIPKKELKIGLNPHTFGGNIRKPLILPDIKKFELKINKIGNQKAENTKILANYLKELICLNEKNRNFRIMSPDELSSNKLDAVLEETKRAYNWPHSKEDSSLSPDGRVMEILSEHTLQAWLQGYLLTGRHGIFPSYEAFLPIVDSMVSQYLKFIATSKEYMWRKPVSALNYLLTSVCWRQDHNGFSHQNPGFISAMINKAKEEQMVRIYFPADANMLLLIAEHILQSTDRVNMIVSDKQPIRQWQTIDEAKEQAKTGVAVWKFASDGSPDIVLAACGDYQTQETLAAISILKKEMPELKIRFVNISELNVLGTPYLYPNGIREEKFCEIFAKNLPVLLSFHGYPGTIKQLLFDRPNNQRFQINGYSEKGTTTTPFDLLVRNEVSRYHIAIRAVNCVSKENKKVAEKANSFISRCRKNLENHKKYIVENGKDPEEIDGWLWK